MQRIIFMDKTDQDWSFVGSKLSTFTSFGEQMMWMMDRCTIKRDCADLKGSAFNRKRKVAINFFTRGFRNCLLLLWIWTCPSLTIGTLVRHPKQNRKQRKFQWLVTSHVDLHCLKKYLFWSAGLNDFKKCTCSNGLSLRVIPLRRVSYCR